eukprot:2799885-Rhodomonas_salina.1
MSDTSTSRSGANSNPTLHPNALSPCHQSYPCLHEQPSHTRPIAGESGEVHAESGRVWAELQVTGRSGVEAEEEARGTPGAEQPEPGAAALAVPGRAAVRGAALVRAEQPRPDRDQGVSVLCGPRGGAAGAGEPRAHAAAPAAAERARARRRGWRQGGLGRRPPGSHAAPPRRVVGGRRPRGVERTRPGGAGGRAVWKRVSRGGQGAVHSLSEACEGARRDKRWLERWDAARVLRVAKDCGATERG